MKNIRAWDIAAQIDLALVTLTIFYLFFHVICCTVSQKNIVHEVLDKLKNVLGSISPKITQKTENDAVKRYRFGWNFDSKFYVRKQIFWAIGESGRGFGLKIMRKSNLKKKLKETKKTKFFEYGF